MGGWAREAGECQPFCQAAADYRSLPPFSFCPHVEDEAKGAPSALPSIPGPDGDRWRAPQWASEAPSCAQTTIRGRAQFAIRRSAKPQLTSPGSPVRVLPPITLRNTAQTTFFAKTPCARLMGVEEGR
jgi:hypothetical protein